MFTQVGAFEHKVAANSVRNFVDRRPFMTKKIVKETPLFADWVRQTMNEKDLRFREVQNLSKDNIHRSTLNKILNEGLVNITVRTIRGLADALGKSPEEVLQKAMEQEFAIAPTEEDLRFAALFHQYKILTPEDKEDMQRLIEVVENEIERMRRKA